MLTKARPKGGPERHLTLTSWPSSPEQVSLGLPISNQRAAALGDVATALR